MLDGLYTPLTAAQLAGVTRQAVMKAIYAKRLAAHKVGNGWLIERADLLRWIAATADRRECAKRGSAR
jgi:excisionase family DNA binding protein